VYDLPAWVRANAGGYWHLRVVDASIFLTLPRANTNIPTIAAAEFIAASMQNEIHDS
jgi:choline dehydrogenase-like flavoprotein